VKRFLVTGGAGFIGSHLVDAILARDLGEVCVLDNFRRGRREHLAQHANDPRLCIHEGDIRDPETVRVLTEVSDVVFHLAAQSNVIGAGQDVSYSVETNVLGTVNVLNAARDCGVGLPAGRRRDRPEGQEPLRRQQSSR
jgi:nucleoside-diphosphate-sugar epimerase